MGKSVAYPLKHIALALVLLYAKAQLAVLGVNQRQLNADQHNATYDNLSVEERRRRQTYFRLWRLGDYASIAVEDAGAENHDIDATFIARPFECRFVEAYVYTREYLLKSRMKLATEGTQRYRPYQNPHKHADTEESNGSQQSGRNPDDLVQVAAC
jgi:hypothetical protein